MRAARPGSPGGLGDLSRSRYDPSGRSVPTRSAHMSATPDSTFSDLEQRIADLERQLAERTAERDAGLQRETATAEVLRVINSSPGDLLPVFEAILDKALSLCEASFGFLYVCDGEFFHTKAWRGVPPALVQFFRQPFRAGRGYGTRRLAEGEAIVHI